MNFITKNIVMAIYPNHIFIIISKDTVVVGINQAQTILIKRWNVDMNI